MLSPASLFLGTAKTGEKITKQLVVRGKKPFKIVNISSECDCLQAALPNDSPAKTVHLIRTNNPLERIMREIRRRTRVVGAFPDGRSALMLVAARSRHIASTRWGTKRYLDMERLREKEQEEANSAIEAIA